MKYALVFENEIKSISNSPISYGGEWSKGSLLGFNESWEFVKLENGNIVEDVEKKNEVENQRRVDALIAKGRKNEQCCNEVRQLINGYNVDRNLTLEQIQTMLTTFSQVNSFLKEGMPTTALSLVASITPDDIIVTSEMLTDVINTFKKYGFEK